jgi:hypothetical protein
MASKRGALIAIITCSLLLGMSPASAGAPTAIERAVERRREAAASMKDLRKLLREREATVKIRTSFLRLVVMKGGPHAADWTRVLARSHSHSARELRGLAKMRRRVERRVRALDRQRDRLGRWLDGLTFRVCPVPEYTAIADNFGVMVRIPKVPVHRHMGNDVAAPTGSPIVAPFDGYAMSYWNHLGGLSVKVYGARGYIYNAHLSAVGSLGRVHTGQVVGYIGSTGDATGPHDHVEWHPGDGGAVDPHALLAQACLPVSP